MTPGLRVDPLRAALMALLLAPATAHTQTVHGVVVENGTRDRIAAVSVELIGRDGSTAGRAETDSAGAFTVRARRGGVYTVRLAHPSFRALDSDTLEIGPGEVLQVQLRMGRDAIPLDPLIVTGQSNARLGGFYERLREPGFGRFVTRADIESRPAVQRVTELLRGMPGVEIVPVRRGRGGSTVAMIMTRGGATGRCQPTIVLDGSPVRQFAESGVDDFLKADMIEGVEVYSSAAGAPAQFVEPGTCGVVAFWTRTGGDEGEQMSLRRLLMAAGAVGLLLLLVLFGS